MWQLSQSEKERLLPSSAFLFSSDPQWCPPTLGKANWTKSTESNANLSCKCLHRHIQKECLTRYLGIPEPNEVNAYNEPSHIQSGLIPLEMALVSIPIQFQCPYSKQDSLVLMLGSLCQFRLGLRDYSGSSIPAFLTQQPGWCSSMLLLPEHHSAQKSFVFYATTTFRANILCVTFKTIPQASPPCPSHCICDTLSLYSPHEPN